MTSYWTPGKLALRQFAVMTMLCAGAVSAAAPAVETKIGMEGVYFLRTEQAGIIARPFDERSPIALRIASVVRDGQSLFYEVRYLGTRAGEHDLRDHLARSDGQALVLPPAVVSVVGTLARDHDGRLEQHPPLRRPFVLPYRSLLQAGLVIWGGGLLALVVLRLTRKRQSIDAEVLASDLADQLHPLVEAALAGRLDAAGQAQLERLLLFRWQRELDLSGLTPEDALQRMRAHPVAGELLRALEDWLHVRPGTRTVDVAALLTPYRGPNPFRDAFPAGATSA